MPALVFDFGTRHIGIAVAEPRAGTASPVATASSRKRHPAWPEIDRAIETWAPDLLVVGLPLNMDGTESDMSAAAREFGELLALRYALGVEFADERLSSFEAASRGGAGRPDHALAAVVIAETWLAERSD